MLLIGKDTAEEQHWIFPGAGDFEGKVLLSFLGVS